jgi:hypothetical protein
VGVPLLQRPVMGAADWIEPFDAPQVPSADLTTSHDARVLPFVQVHDHGPLPFTVLGVPTEQRLSLGAFIVACVAALPQFAITSCAGAGDGTGVDAAADEASGALPLSPVIESVEQLD